MTPVSTPLIETERLVLRGPDDADVDTWAEYLSDPDVLRYLPRRPLTPHQRTEQTFNAIKQAWQQQPWTDLGWVITLKDGGHLVGWCAAGAYENSPDEAELVYSLGKPYWGKGLATEAARAVVRFSFENTGWERIGAAIIPENIASRRVLEHLRFVYEKDVNYYELTGDTTLDMDSPIVPYFVLRRDQFVPDATLYLTYAPRAGSSRTTIQDTR